MYRDYKKECISKSKLIRLGYGHGGNLLSNTFRDRRQRYVRVTCVGFVCICVPVCMWVLPAACGDMKPPTPRLMTAVCWFPKPWSDPWSPCKESQRWQRLWSLCGYEVFWSCILNFTTLSLQPCWFLGFSPVITLRLVLNNEEHLKSWQEVSPHLSYEAFNRVNNAILISCSTVLNKILDLTVLCLQGKHLKHKKVCFLLQWLVWPKFIEWVKAMEKSASYEPVCFLQSVQCGPVVPLMHLPVCVNITEAWWSVYVKRAYAEQEAKGQDDERVYPHSASHSWISSETITSHMYPKCIPYVPTTGRMMHQIFLTWVSPSPPAVEGWKWLTDSAVGRTETAAAAAEG